MNLLPKSIPGVPSQNPTPKGVWDFWDRNRHESQKYNGTEMGFWDELRPITTWLSEIKETDPATINAVLSKCKNDPAARAYFLHRAAQTEPDRDQTEKTPHFRGKTHVDRNRPRRWKL